MVLSFSKRLLPGSIALIWLSAAAAQDVGYLNDTDGNVVRSGAGLCWRTNYWTPSMAIEACDPDLVKPVAAAAPEPEPEVQAAVAPEPEPMKPAAQKVNLAADTLFEFNKAVLRPEGRQKLDEIVSSTHDMKLDAINAVGYADNIGSESYNKELSQRRAEAVKDYLISKGIEENVIYTEGQGEAHPVVQEACQPFQRSGKVNKALIDCLQPNRRVELEVIGTQ